MNSTSAEPARRLLILAATTGYQSRAFAEAAEKLGLEVAFGTDRCHVLQDPWRDHAIALRFEDPDESAARIVKYARSRRIDAVVALGDRPTPTAARACRQLGLPFHSPVAADVCRDKYRSRERLLAAGIHVPRFARFASAERPAVLLPSQAYPLRFPCVLKPTALSGSRGVIRADDRREFENAFERIRALLRAPDVRVLREPTNDFIQVEDYIDGVEIAVEGVIDRGTLKVLAIFDKPDPLTGPFFEETIYVTPSRLPPRTQDAAAATLRQAARALGLEHGPFHAELRIDPATAPEKIWIMEIAARSIGGLCSRALRFSVTGADASREAVVSLEELLIRLALGESVDAFRREGAASGVMMIPVPAAGILEGVEGEAAGRAVPGIEDLVITAKLGEQLVPLPEGASYLGFIFARGRSPEMAESALRCSHGKLRFAIAPALAVVR